MEQLEHLTSHHAEKMKEDSATIDSETALDMPLPIKSESDICFHFSNQKSRPTAGGCILGGTGNEVTVLDIKTEIESCSLGRPSAENDCKALDVKTEIKSELTIDECGPSEFTLCIVNPLEGSVASKEELHVVRVSDAQKNSEVNVNNDGLKEAQGVECDPEALLHTEPKGSHQNGHVGHGLGNTETAEPAETLSKNSRKHGSWLGPKGTGNDCKPLDIKSELKMEEYEPSELTGWFDDTLEGHVKPKEETDVVGVSDGHVQKCAEATLKKESVDETQEVECEVLTLTEPKKSYQDGRVCHVLRYKSTAKTASGEDDEPETLPESSSELPSTCRKRKSIDGSRGKGTYPCPTCGRTFSWKSNLSKHQILHTGEKPHACQLCGKSFSRKDYLNDHMLIHTTGRGKIREGFGGRRFSCDLCGKNFLTRHVLLEHRKRHTQGRPFKCDQCNKDFKLQRDLTDHQRIHTAEKSHVCSACGQRFTRAYSLQKHLVKHTGQRPFSCPHCQKKFKSKWGLTCHVKKCTDAQMHNL